MKPHILRRFKRDVFKNFPKKKEVIIRIEMTRRQKQLSKLIIKKNYDELQKFEKNKNTVKVSVKSAGNILMLLRMIANHPLLLSNLYATDRYRQMNFSKKDEYMEDVDQINEA